MPTHFTLSVLPLPFHHVNSGRISIDGVHIRNRTRVWLAWWIGIVAQDVFLLA